MFEELLAFGEVTLSLVFAVLIGILYHSEEIGVEAFWILVVTAIILTLILWDFKQ